MAVAEYKLNETDQSFAHFSQVYAQNSHHSNALLYLGLIAAEAGNKDEAIKTASLLNTLDKEAAQQLNDKLGIFRCLADAC